MDFAQQKPAVLYLLTCESCNGGYLVLTGLPGTDPVPFVLHSVFLHASLETLFQAAKPTLVPFVLVNHATAVETALKNMEQKVNLKRTKGSLNL